MSLRSLLFVTACAIGLTVVFWRPLWQGGGLIGGDLYPYFFPQKTVYADELRDGNLPLWNRMVGFGYPLLAESQTGVLYPPNPLLYRVLSVNAAYNVSQLAHYVLAFVCTWLLMRRLDLSAWGATLAAVVFVYGWFPPRICLEWAIIGGVYLPLCLWCVESFLQTGRRGWLVGLAAASGVHLLAGHFNLAFITQLTVVGYALLRVAGRADSLATSLRNGPAWRRGIIPIGLAVACGFALAAVQLLPTWELKQRSQREEVGAYHDPGYGHIPPWYLSQIVAPWLWYTADSDPDQALNAIKVLSIPSATNKVEAHLYFGIVPLLLACYRVMRAARGGDPLDRRHLILLLLGLAAMVYATGWLLPLSRHLPGFSFFMGPGRYGIVMTLAAGLLAGAGLDALLFQGRAIPQGRATLPRSHMQGTAYPRRLGGSLARPFFGAFLAMLAICLTLADLHWVSRRVTYAVMVPDPPISHRRESEVRRILTEYQDAESTMRPGRIWAPGANVATLTGFPATPVYLGLGPAEYFDPVFILPQFPANASPSERRETLARQKHWLNRAAVTHVLRMEPLDPAEWPEAHLVWQGFDRLLNPAWGRFQEPLFLYELKDPGPFAQLEPASPGDAAIVESLSSESATLHVSVATEKSVLSIAQLNYPGWSVRVDGRTQSIRDQGEFLAVELPAGAHVVEFRYRPAMVWRGTAISSAAWCALLGFLVTSAVGRNRVRLSANADAARPPG